MSVPTLAMVAVPCLIAVLLIPVHMYACTHGQTASGGCGPTGGAGRFEHHAVAAVPTRHEPICSGAMTLDCMWFRPQDIRHVHTCLKASIADCVPRASRVYDVPTPVVTTDTLSLGWIGKDNCLTLMTTRKTAAGLWRNTSPCT